MAKNDRDDPYKFHRTEPLDINDSQGRIDLALSPLADDGREVMVPKHIPVDELKDIADRTSRSLSGASESQVEAAHEFLRERGIEPPRRRFYSYSK